MPDVFLGGATASRSVSNSSANVQVPTTASAQVRIASEAGGAVSFIKFGKDSSVTAATTDMPILPGTVEVFTRPPDSNYMAAITASGTATLYVTVGAGA